MLNNPIARQTPATDRYIKPGTQQPRTGGPGRMQGGKPPVEEIRAKLEAHKDEFKAIRAQLKTIFQDVLGGMPQQPGARPTTALPADE